MSKGKVLLLRLERYLLVLFDPLQQLDDLAVLLHDAPLA